MKIFYLGASLRKGNSAKTGRPYSIGEITYAVPDESASKNDENGGLLWTYTGYGMRERKIDMAPDSIDKFRDVKPCSFIELDIQPIPENPSRNQVVGVK